MITNKNKNKSKQNKRIIKTQSMKQPKNTNSRAETPLKPLNDISLPQMTSQNDLMKLLEMGSNQNNGKAKSKPRANQNKRSKTPLNTQLPATNNWNILENANGQAKQSSLNLPQINNGLPGIPNGGLPRTQGVNPLLMDPSNLANAYYAEILRNPISLQRKLELVNMNRISLMQQALSNMFASTNLYQLMHKANWHSKPPGKVIFI